MANMLVFDAVTKTYTFIPHPQPSSTAEPNTNAAPCQPTQPYPATYTQEYEMAQTPDLISDKNSEGSTTSEDSYFVPYGWPFDKDEVGHSSHPCNTEGDVKMGGTPRKETGEATKRSAARRSTPQISSYILRDEEDDEEIYARGSAASSRGQDNDNHVIIGNDDEEEEEEEEPKPRTLTTEEVQARILARRKLVPRSIKERLEMERAGHFFRPTARCSCTSFTNCVHDRGTLLCPSDRRVQRIVNDADEQRVRREWAGYQWQRYQGGA